MARIAGALGRPVGRYIEPFLGSGAVLLGLRHLGVIPPGHPVLVGDVNPRLVATHIAVRDQHEAVAEALARLPTTDWRDRYYEVRDAFNTGPHEGPEHAARFLWINTHCFNGLYRENSEGGFNVACGDYKNPRVKTLGELARVSASLQGAEIRCVPYGTLMSDAQPGDVIYCDPPYVESGEMETEAFTAYSANRFGALDQRLLVNMARRLGATGVQVVISNHDTPETRLLYQGFQIESFPVRRSIGRTADSRIEVRELLARVGP